MTKEKVIQTLIDDYSKQAKLSKREQTIFEHGLLTGIDLNREPAWKPADGDELPEIDREVIALIPAYDGWKVVFAHRPDPEGYWGKSVLSDEYKHFLPETYDGWNIPNIKWWLDLDLPKTDE